MKKYRAAVIGCGRIGCGFDQDPRRNFIATHAGAYQSLKNIKLVALVDQKPALLKKYQKKFKAEKIYTDYHEMLRVEKPDIVSIATPPEDRLSLIEECLRSGVRGIYSEKPLAADLETGEDIVRLCAQSKTIFQVNHQRRFTSFFIQLKDLIESGKLGKVQRVFFNYTGGISNNGTHLFDLLRFLFGDSELLRAYPAPGFKEDQKDPQWDIDLEFQNRVPATIRAFNMPCLVLFELIFYTTRAKVEVDAAHYTGSIYHQVRSARFSEYDEYKLAKKLRMNLKKESPMVQGVKHLIACMEGKKKNRSTAADGLAALKVVLDISSRKKQEKNFESLVH